MKVLLTFAAILLVGFVKAQTGSVYTNVQIKASFPGGPDAMKLFFKRYGLKVVSDSSAGTASVSMIVDKAIGVKDVVIANSISLDRDLKKKVETAFKTPPHYMPAIQDGHAVTSRIILYLEDYDW